MIRLNVDLDLVLQAVAAQKAVDRGHVVVVLVFGRFARFGFNQNRAFETDFVFVLNHHVHEAAHLVQLMADAGVEQRFITFAAAPQHVVLAAEFVCGIHRFLDLQGGHGKNLWVRIGGRARHEAPVTEQIGCAPQQLDTCGLLLGAQNVDHGTQMIHAVTRRSTLRSHIAVVKAVVRRAQLAEKFKRCVGLGLGS